jgi:N-acetyl sugar amidotransferase
MLTEVTTKIPEGVRYCKRCIYHERIPAISFDEEGICNYCRQYDDMQITYPVGAEGEKKLLAMADEIRKAGKGKPYDVVIGVSGGCDSSYLIHLAKELGLRPLAAHFDNTWNSTIAVENIKNVLEKQNVDLFTHVADNHEVNDVMKSLMLASIPEIEAATDLALATVHYMACEKFGIKYIWEGHSFRTEGISPPGWFYMDAKYIVEIQKEFGHRPIKTIPLLYMSKWFKWMLVNKIKKQRPLYYMDYNKEQTKKLLAEKYDWKWYGGHHMENRTAYLCNNYYLPVKFDIDLRWCELSAHVRSGQLTRQQALDEIKRPKPFDKTILEELFTRLNFTEAEFDRVMNLPRKTYRDYKTYKETFIRLRPFFWMLYKTGYVTRSFYDKFTVRN